MPLFDFECIKCGLRREELYYMGQEAPPAIRCRACDSVAVRRVGLPVVKIGWNKTPIDRCKDAWSGTGLEDSDGINPMQFNQAEDGKLQLDMGKKTTIGKNSTVRA